MSFYKNLCYSIKKTFRICIKNFFFSQHIITNGRFKIKRFKFIIRGLRYIIEFLTRKRGVNNYKHKSNNELLHALKEYKSKNNQQQKIKSKNKERIDVIREELKELSYKLSKSELKEIKKNLYKIENKKGLLE